MRYPTGENTQALQLLRLPELLLKLLLSSDIAGDIGYADNLPCFVTDRRDGQRHLNLLAVFADTHCFKVFRALPLPQPVKDFSLFLHALGRK